MTRKRIITDPTVRPDAPARARGAKGGVTHAEVRELALALPEAEEKPSYGTPGFKVKNKLFARLREDGETLVVKTSFEERDGLIAADPDTYYLTDHYLKYEWVLVRLSRIHVDAMTDLLRGAWRSAAATKRRPAVRAKPRKR